MFGSLHSTTEIWQTDRALNAPAKIRQTSSLYWTPAKSGFLVLFCNIFALMENGLEKFPPYHYVRVSAMDWHLLHCAREDVALEN